MVDVGPLDALPAIARLATAHRGNLHRALPDNSLSALREASAARVPLLEVDVRRSVEGDLFLFHDGSLSTSNSYPPSELLGRPVQSLARDERRSVFLNYARSITIPDLREGLAAISGTTSSLQLDLKGESDTLARESLALVASMGLLDRVLVQLRTTERVALIRREFPRARIIARCLTMEQVGAAIALGVEAVELERWVRSDAIRAAHAAGVRVLINVAGSRLDEPSTWDYLRSRGVDIIMTDRADRHLVDISPPTATPATERP